MGIASTCSPSDMGSVPCLRVLVNASSGPSYWLDSIVDQPSLLPALVLLCDVSVAERAVAKVSTGRGASSVVMFNHCANSPDNSGAVETDSCERLHR